jgi:hypothetical protein
MPVSAVVNWSCRDDEVLLSLALRWESAGAGQRRCTRLQMQRDGSLVASRYTVASFAGDITLVRSGFIEGAVLDVLPGTATDAAGVIGASIPSEIMSALPSGLSGHIERAVLAFFTSIGDLLRRSAPDVDSVLDQLSDEQCRSVVG